MAYQTQIDQLQNKILDLENNLENALQINEVVERDQYQKIKEITMLKKESAKKEKLKNVQLEKLEN